MKVCTKCKIEKPFEAFWRNKATYDRYVSSCIECLKLRKLELKKNPLMQLKKQIKSSVILENKLLKRENKRLCNNCKEVFLIDDLVSGVFCKECSIEKSKEYNEKNKEKRSVYRENNKEKIKKIQSEYYKKNKEKINEAKKEYLKEYYEKNKEKRIEQMKEYDKKYYEKNKDKLIEKMKEYNKKHYEKNKDKMKEKNKKYYEKKKLEKQNNT